MSARARQSKQSHLPTQNRWGVAAIWLAVLSLIVLLPGAFGRWLLPKEFVLVIAALLASFAVMRGRVSRMVLALIAAGALTLLTAALLSDTPMAALWGRWPRYEGLVALPVYAVAVWVGARLLGPAALRREQASWYRALALASLLLGFVSVLEAFGLRPISTTFDRPGALLGNATDQGLIGAAFALLLIPVVAREVSVSHRERQHQTEFVESVMLPAGGVLFGLLSAVLSGSRAGLLALAVGLIVLGVLGALRPNVERRARTVTLAATALALLVVAMVALVVPQSRTRLLVQSELAAQTVSDRWSIWSRAIEIAADYPLFGVGPSGFVAEVATRHDQAWFDTVGAQTTLDSPHNVLLQALMAGGLPLLLLAVALAATVLAIGIKRWREASRLRLGRSALLLGALAAGAGIGAGLLTHFTSASTGILLGLLIGIVTARETGESAVEPSSLRRVRSVLLAMWALWFALTTFAEIPLQRAMVSASAEQADAHFSIVQALRPWDADLASIAAQTFAARADSGDADSREPAMRWSEQAVQRLPADLGALHARGVAQRSNGLLQESRQTFELLIEAQPLDARYQMQLGIVRVLAGEFSDGLDAIELAAQMAPGDESIAGVLRWARNISPASMTELDPEA